MSSSGAGILRNRRQFALLVLLNAFVGGMVGLERTILPLLGRDEFALATTAATFSFIVSFGFTKAGFNLLSGYLADRIGRKRLLTIGWLLGLPVPLLIIWAPDWRWVVIANVFLGANQALTWSMTVVMKFDLAGARERGLAAGLNEFAGYGGVALLGLVSGYVADATALRPYPFLLGIGLVAIGTFISVVLIRETRPESGSTRGAGTAQSPSGGGGSMSFAAVFAAATWRDRTLVAFSQGGLATNLKDGAAWGLFPLYLASAGLELTSIAVVVAAYPAAWGVGQLVTGPLSDRFNRKIFLVGGLWVQGIGLAAMLPATGMGGWLAAATLTGIGTAMVYPTFLAAVSDVAQPEWRATALGVYRMWRDSGYAFGALLAGFLIDFFSVGGAIVAVAALLALSGIVVLLLMSETPRGHDRPGENSDQTTAVQEAGP